MSRRSMIILFIIVLSLSNYSADGSGSVGEPIEYHVGVILHFETPMGIMSSRCISIAVEDFYEIHDHYMTRVVLHPKDSTDVLSAVFAAKELLVKEKVQAIVGPQTSAEADFVAELGNKAQVPIVSFSATSRSISRTQMPYFVRMAQNDSYQLAAIASIIFKFKWKGVILVYEDSDYGSEIIPSLIDIFEAHKVRIPYKTVLPAFATDTQILEELVKLSSMPTRVFIVHMSTQLGLRFFKKVKEIGLMTEGNAWIITEEMTSVLVSMNDSVIESMHGILGIKPYIPSSKQLNDFHVKMSVKYLSDAASRDSWNVFCLHAYDTIWALAKAVEIVHANQSFRELAKKENISDTGSLRTSDLGPQLLKETLNSNFKGLSGDIHLVNGELQPLIYEIINVSPQGVKEVGFWSPVTELSLGPDGTSPSHLGLIIWPGESSVVPKGVIPSKGKKLKIGYPARIPFKEFVDINSDGTSVAGFCIDVFVAVMEALPFVVPYEFVAFQKENAERGCNYNDLVHEVYLQNYDAAVGDITITANRSHFVDFSFPYTTGGVAMIIPIKYEKRYHLLILFNIVSSNVWLSRISVLIITVFMIWSLEHGRHSTRKLLSAASNHIREVKKASKRVILVVVMSTLILFGLLGTVFFKLLFGDSGQLVTVEAKDLVKSGQSVGYQKGSHVETVLEQLNFEKSKIKVYNSPEEYDEALERGSENGGVAAIFDEIPYIKGVLSKFCDKYRSVGPIYRMEGFGFVFPIGSPLVPDVSAAILSLTESGRLAQIEGSWFEREGTCQVPPKAFSKSLSLDQIWEIFLLVTVLNWILLLFMMSRVNKHSDNLFGKMQNDVKQSNPSGQETDSALAALQEKPCLPKYSDPSNLSEIHGTVESNPK